MTIKELKEILSTYDENANVVLEYEDSYYGYSYTEVLRAYKTDNGEIVLTEEMI